MNNLEKLLKIANKFESKIKNAQDMALPVGTSMPVAEQLADKGTFGGQEGVEGQLNGLKSSNILKAAYKAAAESLTEDLKVDTAVKIVVKPDLVFAIACDPTSAAVKNVPSILMKNHSADIKRLVDATEKKPEKAVVWTWFKIGKSE